MKHRNRVVVLVLTMGWMVLAASAQQDLVWTFGKNAGIDFSSGFPVPFKTSLDAHEGCASVTRPTGSIAFYTDGGTVYNDRGLIMPNGVLFGNLGLNSAVHSTTQGALIVPWPDDTSRYFLISLEENIYPYTGNLYYSIVDMSLRNGHGDVVMTQRKIFLDSVMTEKMSAVLGNQCNIWVMTRSEKTGVWKAWSIDKNGLASTPVESHVAGLQQNFSHGGIKFSPNRQKMVTSNKGYAYLKAEGLELYDFDPNTGMLSNPMVLDSTVPYYQACFSPDNSKLYAVAEIAGTQVLYQFDLSSSNAAAISASKRMIHADPGYIGDLKISPDNMIYFVGYGSEYVHIIQFPNNPGIASGLHLNAIALAPGTSGKHGLPNAIVVRTNAFPIPGPKGSSCPGKMQGRLSLTPSDTTLAYTYVWTDESGTVLRTHTSTTGDTLSGLNPGLYNVNVRSEIGCDTSIQMEVEILDQTVADFHTRDTICLGDTLLFENNSIAATHSLWDFGDSTESSETNPMHSYREVGNWHVVLVSANEHCADTASKMVVVRDFEIILQTNATLVQRGAEIMLQTQSDQPYSVLSWQPIEVFDKSTASEQRVIADTSLEVIVYATTAYGCTDSATVSISVEPTIFMPSAFSPNQDGRNEMIAPVCYGDGAALNYFRIYDRWGKLVFQSNSWNSGWDGKYNGSPATVGTYFYLYEVTTQSGKVIRKHGDLTLIR